MRNHNNNIYDELEYFRRVLLCLVLSNDCSSLAQELVIALIHRRHADIDRYIHPLNVSRD